MKSERLNLVDGLGNCLADVEIASQEDGWFVGRLVSHRFTPEIRAALDWYDEVVENQMLSYLDQATSAVEQIGFRVRFPDGTSANVYSLHIDAKSEVRLRITPVPPLNRQTKSVLAEPI
jgi:hypothetical protein